MILLYYNEIIAQSSDFRMNDPKENGADTSMLRIPNMYNPHDKSNHTYLLPVPKEQKNLILFERLEIGRDDHWNLKAGYCFSDRFGWHLDYEPSIMFRNFKTKVAPDYLQLKVGLLL